MLYFIPGDALRPAVCHGCSLLRASRSWMVPGSIQAVEDLGLWLGGGVAPWDEEPQAEGLGVCRTHSN